MVYLTLWNSGKFMGSLMSWIEKPKLMSFILDYPNRRIVEGLS